MHTSPQADKPRSRGLEIAIAVFGGVAGIVGCVTGMFGCSEGKQSRLIADSALKVAQDTYDRAAAKKAAKVSLVGLTPKLADLPKAVVVDLPPGTRSVRFANLEQLRSVDPRLLIENSGDEVVEALRLEAKLAFIAFHFPENPPEKEFAELRPWLFKQSEAEDVSLSRKLNPSEKASIRFASSLVSRFLQVQPNIPAGGKDCYLRFEIKCYARIAGATAFDDLYRNAVVVMTFVFDPKGFPEDKCKAFLETFKPAAEILNTQKMSPSQ